MDLSPGQGCGRRADCVRAVGWWEKSSPSTDLAHLKASGVGVYAVANRDEAGTRHGAPLTFRNLGEGQAKLLIGPATHCASRSG
ncbi:hypothetical protein [Phenylobacterium sp.]|uniref:hypothetical protein n=1 Tax=Phenylobacterium sp. TaxID=1871053 RepID=UPI002E35D9B9|nr:hypothetical protein [Phenylobacterium sp.]HEX2559642.1 hypothetical protein [Phenylobacterium sp.]